MFKRLIKNKKAQNTAEYAILISLVVAGIIAMQTYAQRALQARVRDASVYMADTVAAADTSGTMASTAQYEPYYLNSTYNVAADESQTQNLDANNTRQIINSTRNRVGSQTSSYNNAGAI